MKFIFMLLTLFVLADPVLAKPVDNTSECLKMYRTYMNDYGASKFIPAEQMFTFFDRCIPSNSANSPANSAEPQHQKLLQIIDADEKIITVKA